MLRRIGCRDRRVHMKKENLNRVNAGVAAEGEAAVTASQADMLSVLWVAIARSLSIPWMWRRMCPVGISQSRVQEWIRQEVLAVGVIA